VTGMGKMLKQAQQMQAKLLRIQEEIAGMEAEGSAAVVNGKKDLISISIDRDFVDPDDVGMLEDMVLTAVRQAAEKAAAAGQEKMSGLTGGMNIPGLGM